MPGGNASGAFEGQAHISRRGRPGLRLTVWRAIWPLLIHNSVMAAKYAAMIAAADAAAAQAAQAQPGTGSRQASAAAAARARRAKARVACAASLLRWIYSMAGCDTGWDPDVASGTPSQHAPGPRRRPPEQRFAARTRTGALDLLPDEGRASPHPPRGSPRR